jgi:hypothetical protein
MWHDPAVVLARFHDRFVIDIAAFFLSNVSLNLSFAQLCWKGTRIFGRVATIIAAPYWASSAVIGRIRNIRRHNRPWIGAMKARCLPTSVVGRAAMIIAGRDRVSIGQKLSLR